MIANDKTQAGFLATKMQVFGEFSRYAVAAVHTRFDHVSWFIWDAERLDENGKPTIIRHEDSEDLATSGLA